jgi:8-oxo-dGTP pyrophosphatase MutT (NUDIX family)
MNKSPQFTQGEKCKGEKCKDNILYCNKKCCQIKVGTYKSNKVPHKHSPDKKKSGIFIFDKNKNKVLMVQSRGNLWGFPKGTMKNNESIIQCALREVLEETGLTIKEEELEYSTVIKEKSTYYFVSKEECPVVIQNHIFDNDANSIGWINIDFLEQLIKDNVIVLNQHSRIVFKRFIDKSF